MPCPHCGEEVLLRWAQISGDLVYLRCWNDHRFGVDGGPLEVGDDGTTAFRRGDGSGRPDLAP